MVTVHVRNSIPIPSGQVPTPRAPGRTAVAPVTAARPVGIGTQTNPPSTKDTAPVPGIDRSAQKKTPANGGKGHPIPDFGGAICFSTVGNVYFLAWAYARGKVQSSDFKMSNSPQKYRRSSSHTQVSVAISYCVKTPLRTTQNLSDHGQLPGMCCSISLTLRFEHGQLVPIVKAGSRPPGPQQCNDVSAGENGQRPAIGDRQQA